MSRLPFLLAIVNCRLAVPSGEFDSGVVMVKGGVVAASGKDVLMAVPPHAILLDAEDGLVGMGTREASGLHPIRLGAEADLVCQSPDGETRWAMRKGIFVYPDREAVHRVIWQAWREASIYLVMDTLARREEHIAFDAGDAGTGEDFIWRFRDGRGKEQRTSIRVIPDLGAPARHLALPDDNLEARMPEADPFHTRAHWWFHVHAGDETIYCIPAASLKHWLRSHAAHTRRDYLPMPAVPLSVRVQILSFRMMQEAIPRARTLRFTTPLSLLSARATIAAEE